MQTDDLAIPVLPSRSVGDAVAFYRQLGFEGEVHSWGGYAIVRRGSIELHFSEMPELDPAKSIAVCYLRVIDVESIYRAFSEAKLPAQGIPRQEMLEEKPWGLREFAMVDPDGNLLRIGQLIGRW